MPELVFDREASNPDNYITDELVEQSATSADLIVPLYGAFYDKDFELRLDGQPGPLTLGTDYDYVSLDPALTALTGIDVINGLVLKGSFAGTVNSYRIDYRAVGGKEGNNNYLIRKLREAVEEVADGTIDYNALEGLPATYPPEPHDHSMLDELTDLEPLRESMEGIWDALIKQRPVSTSYKQLFEQKERHFYLIAQMRNEFNQIMEQTLGYQIAKEGSGNTAIFNGTYYYGLTTPLTGPVTHDLSGARFGDEVFIIHNDAAAPQLGNTGEEWSKKGDGAYIVNTNNYIIAKYISGTEVHYIIYQ